MNNTRYSEERIIAIPREQEAGIATAEICGRHGVRSATFHAWKAKHGGVDICQARSVPAALAASQSPWPPWGRSIASPVSSHQRRSKGTDAIRRRATLDQAASTESATESAIAQDFIRTRPKSSAQACRAIEGSASGRPTGAMRHRPRRAAALSRAHQRPQTENRELFVAWSRTDPRDAEHPSPAPETTKGEPSIGSPLISLPNDDRGC